MKGERMCWTLSSVKKVKVLKLKDGPQRHRAHETPPPLITAPVQSFAAMHRSPRPSFVIFIGLLGPPKANGYVFDEGEPLLKFNKPPERVRRRTCLPIGAELCGQVQKS